MKKFLLCALGLCALSIVCSCSNSSDAKYNNDTTTTTTKETSIESNTYKVTYMYLTHPIAVYDDEGNLLPNTVDGIALWAGHDYDFAAFGEFTKNSFYCLGDSIKVTYDTAKENKDTIFPYEVVSVERLHTATVEAVSLDDIVRNEDGGIASIGGKSTEYTVDTVKDAIYIADTSLEFNYLSEYKGDVLYRATDPSEGYVYYSFDPTE